MPDIPLGTVVGPQGPQGPQGPKGDTGTFSPEDLQRITDLESGKVDKVAGKGLSTNDYTTAEKNKLSGIEAQANKTTIDATLSNAGQAADAKATGDNISVLRGLISRMEIYCEASGNPATFDDAKAANVKALSVTITPTQSGSGDPSPDNVRPISGVSSVTITRTGKNLLEITNPGQTLYGVTFTVDAQAGTVTANGTATRNIYFLINTFSYQDDASYIISGCPTGGSYSTFYIHNGKLADGFVDYGNGSPAKTGAELDKDSGQSCYINIKEGTTCSNLVFRPMIRLADNDATFEPYRGQTVTVSLTDGANPLTVYGGTLDVTTGALAVTWVNIASYNGETLPGRWISDRDVYAPGTTPTTGAQVVYELATPVTYQLTPQQLATLAGYNAVSSDAVAVDVTYKADASIIFGGG